MSLRIKKPFPWEFVRTENNSIPKRIGYFIHCDSKFGVYEFDVNPTTEGSFFTILCPKCRSSPTKFDLIKLKAMLLADLKVNI